MARKKVPDKHIRSLQYLSTFLRELRINFGLTQQKLSENIGIHRNTIVRAENCHNLTILNLMKLADYYGIDIIQLFQDQR